MAFAAAASVLISGTAAAGPAVDFAAHIQPLLRRSCLECHGPARARGGLRVDRTDSLRAVIAPSNREGSPLYARLLGAGGEPRMPEGKPALAAEDIALVGRWIDAGAPGLDGGGRGAGAHVQGARDHWAYRPPVRPPIPGGGDQNPIDAFLQVERARAGLRPAPEASREALIRRLTLDLTGLPPTLPEIDAFVSDGAPGAYQRLVDRLLASPAFGERWAVPWLDAARYADSNGYEKDGARPVWKYRDWVVAALNADMPFDQFTVEQIAGDLLPKPTLAQRIATGFHRNTMLNEEAGVDPDEARWERLVDRVSTTGTIWLGSTLACAQCHDHKHDPFSQRDFYGLLAFFESAEEQTLPLPTAPQASRLAALDAEIAGLQRTLDTWTPALGQAQARWEATLRERDGEYRPLQGLTGPRGRGGAASRGRRRHHPGPRGTGRSARPGGDGRQRPGADHRRSAGGPARPERTGRRARAGARRRVLPGRSGHRGRATDGRAGRVATGAAGPGAGRRPPARGARALCPGEPASGSPAPAVAGSRRSARLGGVSGLRCARRGGPASWC